MNPEPLYINRNNVSRIAIREDGQLLDFTAVTRYVLMFEGTTVTVDTDVNANAITGDSNGVVTFDLGGLNLNLEAGYVRASLIVYDALHPDGQTLLCPKDSNANLIFNVIADC